MNMPKHDDGRPCCTPSTTTQPAAGGSHPRTSDRARTPISDRSTRGQVRIVGGGFRMGDPFNEGYPADGEGPVHEVWLSDFYLDTTAVTNAQYATFVKATGYRTDAEQLGVSAVCHLAFNGDRRDVLHHVAATPWWLAVRGASWRHPEGPGSDVSRRQNHPVAHVSWNDALAYCAWAGKRLPTEAEWEYAARGGLNQARYCWGDELTPRDKWQCNIWQGKFPTKNTLGDGYLTTAPVKTYRPNGFGLWQMAGNVWAWCADWFDQDYYARSERQDPKGPSEGISHVMRGGSYMCHDSYCHRYRVAARSSNTAESTSANVGFRCANDAA